MTPEMCAVLLSWAVHFSGYPNPGQCPEVVSVQHATMEQMACTGHKCKVLGWYPGSGQTIYLDAVMEQDLASNTTNTYATSILVHELVHYLQWVNHKLDNFNCEVALAAEREAYQVQRNYVDAFGTYVPVGQALHSFACASPALANAAPQ